MISKFMAEQDPECSRCVRGWLLFAPKETIPHIFCECPMISNILSELNNLISNNTLDLSELANVVCLEVPEKKIYSIFKTFLIVMATNYFLYKSKKTSGMVTITKYKSFLAFTLPDVFYDFLND